MLEILVLDIMKSKTAVKLGRETREILFYRNVLLRFLERLELIGEIKYAFECKLYSPVNSTMYGYPIFFQLVMAVYMPNEVGSRHTTIHEHNENISDNPSLSHPYTLFSLLQPVQKVFKYRYQSCFLSNTQINEWITPK